jgi:hypothetical protein
MRSDIFHSPKRRREYLRAYIVACIRDGDLSWMDVTNPATVVDKLLKILGKDVSLVVKDLGRQGSAKLLSAGAVVLAGFAESVKKR